MSKARKPKTRVGPIEAQAISRFIIAAKKAKPEPEQDPDEVRQFSHQGIRSIAAGVAESNRIPDAVMIDEILRAYWRMARPNKAELLKRYRERCTNGLPQHWIEHHCQLAAFLETLISGGDS